MNKKIPKIFFQPFFAILFLILLISCNNKETESANSRYKDTTGPVHTITVITDTATYINLESFLNQEDVFGKQLPGSIIPQDLFSIRYQNSKFFENKKETRLVLMIKKGDSYYKSTPNKFANGQAFIEIRGQNTSEIKNIIKKHSEQIYNEFYNTNFLFLKKNLKESINTSKLSKLGLYALLPNSYKIVEDKTNFQWYRRDIKRTIQPSVDKNTNTKPTYVETLETFNILAGVIPYKKDSLEYADFRKIINIAFLKKITEIDTANYMHIPDHITPVLEKTSNTEQYSIYKYDGVWSMKNAFYGGPLLGKIIHDKKNKQINVFNAAFYAPNVYNKRDNTLNTLSIIETFKVLPK